MTTDVADIEKVFNAYPGAPIDSDNFPHYAARLEHRLLVNRCEDCKTFHSPPRSLCPKCWSRRVVPTEVTGDGTIYTLSVLHVGAPAIGVDYAKGFAVGALELAEQPGLRLTAALLGENPYALQIGMPVKLAWLENQGGPVPAFQPLSVES